MTRNLFTVAAALLAGTTIAAAQGVSPSPAPKGPGAEPPPAAIQNAPAEKTAPPVGGKIGGSRAQAPADKAAPGAKAGADAKGAAGTGVATDSKADTKAGANADAKGSKTGKDGMKAQASAPVNLTTEQRTKITTVIKEKHVQPTKVNFDIHVGATVPRTVHLVTLPTEVIAVYPAWRGYEFILVADEIIVVNPNTLRIVAVIPA